MYAAAEVPPTPANVLAQNAHLLPHRGAALDFACGLGSNALFLARRGLEVCAWDLSPVAIGKLAAAAQAQRLSVRAEVRDVEREPWPSGRFEVIVVSHFLCRHLAPSITDMLKPGGLLFYQTYIRAKAAGIGPSNPDYLLESNELLRLFAELTVVAYREEAQLGNLAEGFRDEAMLVAQKPVSSP